jgi:hypothetical protein
VRESLAEARSELLATDMDDPTWTKNLIDKLLPNLVNCRMLIELRQFETCLVLKDDPTKRLSKIEVVERAFKRV